MRGSWFAHQEVGHLCVGYGRTYEFDGNLLVVQQVGTLKDDAKRALAYLFPDSVMNTDDIGGGGCHFEGCR